LACPVENYFGPVTPFKKTAESHIGGVRFAVRWWWEVVVGGPWGM
jgi:hypothetical protein